MSLTFQNSITKVLFTIASINAVIRNPTSKDSIYKNLGLSHKAMDDKSSSGFMAKIKLLQHKFPTLPITAVCDFQETLTTGSIDNTAWREHH